MQRSAAVLKTSAVGEVNRGPRALDSGPQGSRAPSTETMCQNKSKPLQPFGGATTRRIGTLATRAQHELIDSDNRPRFPILEVGGFSGKAGDSPRMPTDGGGTGSGGSTSRASGCPRHRSPPLLGVCERVESGRIGRCVDGTRQCRWSVRFGTALRDVSRACPRAVSHASWAGAAAAHPVVAAAPVTHQVLTEQETCCGDSEDL